MSKEHISTVIRKRIEELGMTHRSLAERLNMHHPQIIRITSCKGYNIGTLLNILDELDLELIIQPKETKDECTTSIHP